MDMAPLKSYLASVEQALRAGNATEHTHRPALKTLIQAIATGVTATNEPKRIKCGAPDYIITRGAIPLGYIEAKDVDICLDEVESDEQLQRYRAGLANLILTDYLEFRWFVAGEHRLTVRLAKPDKTGKLKLLTGEVENFAQMMDGFINADIPIINSPRELAIRMAAMARLIRSIIAKTFASEDDLGSLHQQMEAFQRVLLHDMTAEQFGDMYAQTICYGLFAARCNKNSSEHFTRSHAAYDLPKTNPFLRKMFGHIAGPELDERIVWAVDDLAELLARSDISAILQDFGRRTRQEDPVVHFYETFLGHYDQKMREARGVYYTPEPVVSYIVRSVDAILKNDFKLINGLADSSKIKLTRPKKIGKGTETIETHKVQILDPATGTGTFLYSVIGQIYQAFEGNKGMWTGYVKENLLPRLFGFELLMAPYSVAHMKLGLLLRDTGYDFSSDERLRVFLTNTLEEAHELTGLPLFTQWLAEEAAQAGDIKQSAPIMVVLGNPPYSYESENKGEWIDNLLHGVDTSNKCKTGNYYELDGKPLGERNPKGLQDDYVKFIRFSQWRIEQTGYGILGFVTNHGYLDNPTFRGMRQSLMQSFDDIYLLDLHGNSKKKEKSPDGTKDENVFDIMQGVSIGLFVKHPTRKGSTKAISNVYHAELFGLREVKYEWLLKQDVLTTQWSKITPASPNYLMVPQDTTTLAEYESGWKVTEMYPLNNVGVVTARDDLTIQATPDLVWDMVNEFSQLSVSEAKEKYAVDDSTEWTVTKAQKDLNETGLDRSKIVKILYRPFDTRYTYFTGTPAGFQSRPRREVMREFVGKSNIGLVTVRQVAEGIFNHVLVANTTIDNRLTLSNKGYATLFPVYCYVHDKIGLFDEEAGERRPNLAPEFIADFSARLQLGFIHDGCGDLRKTFGPEDIFHYAYAVFHSPSYRSRYAQFLKADFPHLPLTSNVALFRSLCASGKKLASLHLMEQLPKVKTRYPAAGDNTIEVVRYVEPTNGITGQVWINKTQYFENVPPEVWCFHIGGYQVCQKWLKDRKGRQLSYEDLTHYQQIIAALAETIKLQSGIDDLIGEWPIQ